MKKIGIIHTSFVSVEDLKRLFKEIIPDAELTNIVDDSLLREVSANGGINENIIRKMCIYADNLRREKVDLIFNQCSSVGEAFEIATLDYEIPVLRVDRAAAEKAAEIAKTEIAVVATVKSTVAPSTRIVERAVEKLGKNIRVKPILVDGALEILMKEGDREKHNQLVKEAIREAEKTADVIVLAQGSMLVLEPELVGYNKLILTTPKLGVEMAKEMLK